MRGFSRQNAVLCLAVFLASGCGFASDDNAQSASARTWTAPAPAGEWTGATPVAASPDEPRLRNLRQLTHVGTNAEAYFSAEGDRLIFQATWPGETECDQIYAMDLDGGNVGRLSTGDGRTTCGYFFPGQDRILFSSTHGVDRQCPPPPDRSQGYVWGLFDYDVYARDLANGELQRLTDSSGYDAEATISPDGSTIVFTSMRGGDPDIWAMDADGSNPRQLTHDEGYDGGAFFSADGSKIVYRSFKPESPEELTEYRRLLEQGLVAGGRLEIFVMDADGSNRQQLTDNGASNFAPFFHPNGRQIIFSSNLHSPGGRSFALYLIDLDGAGLERITASDEDFDGFPMFSPDGRHLAFASSRGADSPGEINVFLAEWSPDNNDQ